MIVTCDGTWPKRGFTANYGVVVVISSIALYVLDSPMWPNIIGYMEPNILFSFERPSFHCVVIGL